MEIGSFLELDLRESGEYFQSESIIRLNSARAGIYHAMRIYGCAKIYLPYYLCPTVSAFLNKKHIDIEYYHIDQGFEPLNIQQSENSVMLLVNYFGVLSVDKMQKISKRYTNVIIDNSAAFYMPPFTNAINVYSARKFFGVPDGCYVIGQNVNNFKSEYRQDYSSDTASFLFKRIEYGCSSAYSDRMKNEHRIDESDILLMSDLTKALLSGIDYESIAEKRKANFLVAHRLFKEMNLIDPTVFMDQLNIPMVYPLVVKSKKLMDGLRKNEIYTGRWWNGVLNLVSENSFESFLSNYMLPIPIDQRYKKNQIEYVYKTVVDLMDKYDED